MSSNSPSLQPSSSKGPRLQDEGAFQRMISLERKRTERSRRPFLLMLIDADPCLSPQTNGQKLNAILSAFATTMRETDIIGWYKTGSVVGLMFTELNLQDKTSVVATLLMRVRNALRDQLGPEQAGEINISLHLFPEDDHHDSERASSDPTFYPDLRGEDQSKRSMRFIKRVMDIVGSVAALVVFAPIFLGIAVAIRISSRGPVLFRQRRLGQHGVPFDMLKFRSMHVDNDPNIHKEYVIELIAGRAEAQPTNRNGEEVYKLTTDSRITRIGALLRRTSLDELPQFVNVLKGEMSLVGPRPPLPYEVEIYDLWHRRRLLDVKPGITGLWQVTGRNRTSFDEMVRLDLAYARTWSPWLDMRILLRTPRAVLAGAY
jgi:lipopolysaccharide/colanic/teichoic acid biosynthesis glycosyltransferase